VAIFLPLLLLAVVMASAYASHRWGLWTAAAIVPVAALFFFTGDRTGEALTYITPLIMGTMGGFAVKKKLPLKHYTVITSLAWRLSLQRITIPEAGEEHRYNHRIQGGDGEYRKRFGNGAEAERGDAG
jgi:hypothetical protein